MRTGSTAAVGLVCAALAGWTVTGRGDGAMAVTPVSLEEQRPAIDRVAAARTQRAVFALGWFWGPDSRFGSLPGVVRTRVGYAGGSTPAPTYENIGDHAEAIEIEFDPSQIGYRDLLAVFWEAHDPSYSSVTRQYRTAVFWSGEEQRRLAEQSRDQTAKAVARTVATALEPLRSFTPAEDYHQKYYLRSDGAIAAAFHRIYPDERDFAASTAVARVNGYLGGHGGPDRLAREIDELGLAGEARQALERIVGKRNQSEICIAPLKPSR